MGLFKHKQPAVVDLREVARPPKKILFEFGFPTRCPSCGERGYLDHIDPFKRIQYEHCPACFTKWEQTEADIATLNQINA